MPEIPPQHDAPAPSNASLWTRVCPWVVVYGLILAILLFFNA